MFHKLTSSAVSRVRSNSPRRGLTLVELILILLGCAVIATVVAIVAFLVFLVYTVVTSLTGDDETETPQSAAYSVEHTTSPSSTLLGAAGTAVDAPARSTTISEGFTPTTAGFVVAPHTFNPVAGGFELRSV